jgi:hypothetical protein
VRELLDNLIRQLHYQMELSWHRYSLLSELHSSDVDEDEFPVKLLALLLFPYERQCSIHGAVRQVHAGLAMSLDNRSGVCNPASSLCGKN